jgi:hypothetical protein
MQPHETRAVPVPAALRRGGLVGLALVTALAVATSLWGSLTHHAVAGEWLIVAALGLVLTLVLYTRGFRNAPGWALRAMFATLLTGLALPIFIVGINV